MANNLVSIIYKPYPQLNHNLVVSKSRKLINLLASIAKWTKYDKLITPTCFDQSKENNIYDRYVKKWNKIFLLKHRLSVYYARSITTERVAEMISEFRWIILRFENIKSVRLKDPEQQSLTKENINIARQLKSLADSYDKKICNNLPLNILLNSRVSTVTPRIIQFLTIRDNCLMQGKKGLNAIAESMGISTTTTTKRKNIALRHIRRNYDQTQFKNNRILKETEQLLSLAFWKP